MNVRVLVPERITGPAPDAASPIARLRGRSMGCAWSVTCVLPDGVDQAALVAGITAVLDRVVQQMSTWEPESVISRFNRAGPGSWLPMPDEFALVLACALHVAQATNGALDPAAGGLVTLWGFGASHRYHEPGFAPPTAASIEAARRHGGWQRLQVNTATMQLCQPGGLQLDLSAVAKGFAVDAVSRLLRGHGVEHHLVDVGGELRGMGMKPDGQPWWVDVQLPPGVDATPTRIALHGLAVATSGDYLQGFSVNGRHYSHCIDPRSGVPVCSGVRSVTVLHRDCMLADAWSTALMVLGPEAGMPVAESEQIAAQWLVRAGEGCTEYCSSRFQALVA
jgi:thiamine biosynthesis lipoprotein